MKTYHLLVVALAGAAAAVAGCAATRDDVGSADSAQVSERAADDNDELTVLDRMGRPEMTNVTIGAGLVRLKLAKGAFDAAQAKAAAETDPAKKADAVKEVVALGAELQNLAGELTAESDELKSDIKQDAEAAAAAAGKPAGQRKPTAYFRAYNHQHTFHPKPGERADAKRMLAAGIRALDRLSLDGQTPDPEDWTEPEVLKMAEILSEDALIVSLHGKGDCMHDTQSYFGFERDAFNGAAENPSNCGGRTMNDDIIDDTLTMWVKKSFDFSETNDKRVRDHVVAVTRAEPVTIAELHGTFQLSPALDAFPYFGTPRETPFIGLGSCSVTCRSGEK